MNQESKKLGRGLSSLFSGRDSDHKLDNLKYLGVSQLAPNKNQPRKKFQKQELEELSDSIKMHGILQPIVVRKKSEDLYEIVAGERRWRAAQLASLHEVPVIVKQFSDLEITQAALIENIQRENLNPVEEARAYRGILEDKNINPDNLSKILGKSRSHISNIIRLLDLDAEILNFIEEGKLTMGHARSLIGVPNAIQIAKEIIEKKLSVRDVEKNTSKYKKNRHKKHSAKDPNILDLEKELSEKIGLKTSIHFNDQGSSGSITLFYSNLEQLDELMKRLKK